MHQVVNPKTALSCLSFFLVGFGPWQFFWWPLNPDGAERFWTVGRIRHVKRLRSSRTIFFFSTGTPSISEEYAAIGEVFAPEGARQPIRRWRHCHGTRKCPHGLLSAELLRVAVPSQLGSVHTRGGSRGASRMRRNYGDAAAHLSTHNTQHHTRTYQHQQLVH